MTTRGGFEDPRSDGIVSSFPRRLAAAVLAVGLWAATFASASADVIFNEVMADNQTAFEDDEEFPDWIELYNTSATTDLSLNGWSLTDNPTVTNKFQFPSGTSIPARGFLMVWLDAAAFIPAWWRPISASSRTVRKFPARHSFGSVAASLDPIPGTPRSRMEPAVVYGAGQLSS